MANLSQNGTLVNGFLVKLWKLLENSYDNSIVWSEDGRSFVISDPHAFSHSLPKYFKHSKLSSFIRQLNMYGFRKVTSNMNWPPGDASIKVEDDLHFYHPYFRRGQQDQLNLIRRKLSKPAAQICNNNMDTNQTQINSQHQQSSSILTPYMNQNNHFFSGNSSDDGNMSPAQSPNSVSNLIDNQPIDSTSSEPSRSDSLVSSVLVQKNDAKTGRFSFDDLRSALDEVRACKNKQSETSKMIIDLKKENQILWREFLELRQKYNHQQDVVGALIKFLFNSIYPPPTGGLSKTRKISPKLMIGDNEVFSSPQECTTTTSTNAGTCTNLSETTFSPGNSIPSSSNVGEDLHNYNNPLGAALSGLAGYSRQLLNGGSMAQSNQENNCDHQQQLNLISNTANDQLNFLNSIRNYSTESLVGTNSLVTLPNSLNNLNGTDSLNLINNNHSTVNNDMCIPTTGSSSVSHDAAGNTSTATSHTGNNQTAFDIANWFQEQITSDQREPCVDDFMELFEGQIPEY